MKKSKMIKLMMESWLKPVPYHDDGGLQFNWQIVRLLEDMEKAGMLPPEVKPTPQHIIDNGDWANYWEEE